MERRRCNLQDDDVAQYSMQFNILKLAIVLTFAIKRWILHFTLEGVRSYKVLCRRGWEKEYSTLMPSALCSLLIFNQWLCTRESNIVGKYARNCFGRILFKTSAEKDVPIIEAVRAIRCSSTDNFANRHTISISNFAPDWRLPVRRKRKKEKKIINQNQIKEFRIEK